MTETRYDLEKYHKHMGYDGNTLIWAPRRSGKTWALTRKFVETRNSILLTVNGAMGRDVEEYLMTLGCPDRRRDVHIMGDNVMHGRRVDRIFVDEISHYRGDLADFHASVYPALASSNPRGYYTAVSTPNGVPDGTLWRMFQNQFNMYEDKWITTVTKGIIVEPKPEHFDRELFEI